MAQTGMETAEILKGIISETHPDLIIAIDALAAQKRAAGLEPPYSLRIPESIQAQALGTTGTA